MTVPVRRVPTGRNIVKMCESLGCADEFKKLREGYKKRGMESPEAIERAFVEMNIAARYKDWRTRQSQREIFGSNVPLTHAEIKEVNPGYREPTATQGATVGEQVLSFPEMIRWVQDQYAKVCNGEPSPSFFPNSMALFWFQKAVTKDALWDKAVLKVDVPSSDSDDVVSRDSEFQFSQIESQVKQALIEVGKQFREIESEMAEALDGLVQARPEGSGVEPSVPA